MSDSQKFISRNRAPRVQIEYDVELYGAEKKVQLPFVMGVMADLSGKAEKPAVADRGFLEIDVDNFDDRMRAMAPKAQFTVPNTLTGEGSLAVDLTFQKMSDFSPEAIAENVESLRPLLEARRQLSDLLAYMDGKSGAEALIEKLLSEPALLQAVATPSQGSSEADAALDGLRNMAPQEVEVDDTTDKALASLAGVVPVEAPKGPNMDDVLGAVQAAPALGESKDDVTDILSGITRVEEAEDTDQTGDILSGIPDAPAAETIGETVDDVLGGLEAPTLDEAEPDIASDVLSGIARVESEIEADNTSDILSGIAAAPVDEVKEASFDDVLGAVDAVADDETEDESADILSGIARIEDEAEEDLTADVLSGIVAAPIEEASDTSVEDALSSVEAIADTDDVEDEAPDVLDGLKQNAPSEADVPDDVAAGVLSGIARVEDVVEVDDTGDILSGIAVEPIAEDDDTSLDEILGGLDVVDAGGQDADETPGVLDGLKSEPLHEATQEDATDDILGAVEQVAQAEEEAENSDDILAALDVPTAEEPEDITDDVLSGIAAAPVDEFADDGLEDVLAGLEAPDENAGPDVDVAADILNGLEPVADTVKEDGLGDILSGIDTAVDVVAEDVEADLDDILGGIEDAPKDVVEAEADDVLAGLPEVEHATEDTAGDLDALLAGIDSPEEVEEDIAADDILATLDTPSEVVSDEEKADDVLAGLPEVEVDDAADEDLDALLAGLDSPQESAAEVDLDALLGEIEAPDDVTNDSAADDILASLDDVAADEPEAAEDDLDALLSDLGDAAEEDDAGDDLDALLGDLASADEPETEAAAAEDDLDALLSDLGDAAEEDDAGDDLDALLAGTSDDAVSDLDDLLGDLDGGDNDESTGDDAVNQEKKAPLQSPFGRISAARPDRDTLNRKKFRMAVFGDFTGRASRGVMETGAALAARAPILLDVDTVEDVIEGFATTLRLPIGKDGASIEVKLNELDDLHPDELFDNLDVFEGLSGLRQQLGVSSMADKARERLQQWSDTFGTPVKLPKRSAGTSIPANLKLSDFQSLIGDTSGTLTQASPIDDIIARIVGPHIVKAPDAGAAAMVAAVDDALSTAMRLVLHHPEFQALESQWRSLDLLARRIETDVTLEIVLYDVSAEELAVDLAASEDLSESGLFGLLTSVLDPEEGAGGFSALFGMYTFEETPPHAELLARIGQVGAHVDAPFFAAVTPGYLDVAKEDRHPLVAKAWDTLRSLPEAAYLGLAAPRFMLRQPYGAKSDPVYAFEFEEFTPQEGLSGMLWANPVVLVAILLAGTFKKDGKAMNLGSMMSLGDIPFYYVNDRFGDQVALPCTERNLTSGPTQDTLARGFMPVLSIKGRDEIRLGSFRSLSGDEIAGPWANEVPKSSAKSGGAGVGLGVEATIEGGSDVDDLLAGADGDADEDTSLDDLLAGFDDDSGDDSGDDEEMDPELAALLEGL